MKAFLILEDGTVFDRNEHWLSERSDQRNRI